MVLQTLKGGCYWPSVDKWIAEHDKELNIPVWLKYTVVNGLHVDALLCSVCTHFKSKLGGMCN